MSNIKVTIEYELVDGMDMTIKAPCDYADITGLIVFYPKNGVMTSQAFTFKDAHNNDLSNLDNLFASGAYIKVILNTTNSCAYIQNADTNAYLEARFAECLKKGVSNNSENEDENSMGDTLNMGGHRIYNLGDPINDTDAVNKSYVDNKYKSTSIVLSANNWLLTSKTQTVVVDNVVADHNAQDIVVSPDPSNDNNYNSYMNCNIRCIGQGDGVLSFKCDDVPVIDLTVNISIHDRVPSASNNSYEIVPDTLSLIDRATGNEITLYISDGKVYIG